MSKDGRTPTRSDPIVPDRVGADWSVSVYVRLKLNRARTATIGDDRSQSEHVQNFSVGFDPIDRIGADRVGVRWSVGRLTAIDPD